LKFPADLFKVAKTITAIDKAIWRAYNVRCTRGAQYFLMMGSSKQECYDREPVPGVSRLAKLLNSSRRCGGEFMKPLPSDRR
jgi:hypothetical protein